MAKIIHEIRSDCVGAFHGHLLGLTRDEVSALQTPIFQAIDNTRVLLEYHENIYRNSGEDARYPSRLETDMAELAELEMTLANTLKDMRVFLDLLWKNKMQTSYLTMHIRWGEILKRKEKLPRKKKKSFLGKKKSRLKIKTHNFDNDGNELWCQKCGCEHIHQSNEVYDNEFGYKFICLRCRHIVYEDSLPF